MNCRLKLIDLTKSYGSNRALDHFTYEFTPGIYGLLGPNGAGKSTLMNLITRNLKWDEGQIEYNGRDILEMKNEYLSHVGYMPQQQSVYDNMTLMRFLYYIAALKGIRKKEAAAQVEELLDRVGLWNVQNRTMGSFSGGMKQRALIAQALLGNPDIVVLDEPTAGLDPLQRVSLRKLIQEKSQDKIVIISTHVIADIEKIAREVLMLRKGRLLELCLPDEKRENESVEDMYIRLFE